MTASQITAAALARTKGQPSHPVSDRRGRRVGVVARNTIGMWEAFDARGAHLPGAHLSAKSAAAALTEAR